MSTAAPTDIFLRKELGQYYEFAPLPESLFARLGFTRETDSLVILTLDSFRVRFHLDVLYGQRLLTAQQPLSSLTCRQLLAAGVQLFHLYTAYRVREPAVTVTEHKE